MAVKPLRARSTAGLTSSLCANIYSTNMAMTTGNEAEKLTKELHSPSKSSEVMIKLKYSSLYPFEVQDFGDIQVPFSAGASLLSNLLNLKTFATFSVCYC